MSFEYRNICQQVKKPVLKKIRKKAFFWPLSVYTPLINNFLFRFNSINQRLSHEICETLINHIGNK